MSAGRILVTGASGAIGRATVGYLAQQGVEVVPVGHRPGPSAPVTWELGKPLGQHLSQVDAIVHLAARVHVRGKGYSDEAAFRRENADAVLALAREARDVGVRRFVFMSSIGVFGGASPVPLKDSAEPQPHTAYARSKWMAEEQLGGIEGIEVVTLRPPAVIGRDVRGNVGSIARAVRRGLPLPFAGIVNARQFITLQNLLHAIGLAVNVPGVGGQVFNVANPERVSTPELCVRIGRAIGRKPNLFRFPPVLLRGGLSLLGRSSLAEGLTGDLLIDTHRVEKMLGWTPVQSLDEGLAHMMEGGG